MTVSNELPSAPWQHNDIVHITFTPIISDFHIWNIVEQKSIQKLSAMNFQTAVYVFCVICQLNNFIKSGQVSLLQDKSANIIATKTEGLTSANSINSEP